MSGKLIFLFMAVFVLSSLSFVVSVEADSLMWSQTYGGTGDDGALSLVATSDGGYAIAGYTHSLDDWDDYGNFWLVKTDAYGNMEWNRTYGGIKSELAWSLVATSDGGYAVAGRTRSFGAGESDFWLVKTDEFGNMLWNRTYGGPNMEEAFSVVETSDGGYAIAGTTYSFGAGGSDFWLVKTDESGNMEWNKTYGRTYNDYAQVLVETADGGYVIAGGRCIDLDVLFGDCWLVKTDAYGNMVWNKTYEAMRYNPARSLVATSDGGYAIAGQKDGDFWLVKTDEYGVVPEYSSWLLTSILLVATSVIVIYKKKFFDDHP